MLTVRDLLAGLKLPVLAGAGGLDVPVRWVHISELLDPTPWLSGGEVLLCTGMALDTPARQRALVERLADHRLAGLGFGTGFAHEQVPSALLAAAQLRDFPVFEVPYEMPFIAVTEAAFTQLAGEQCAILRQALAAHERLERIVLSQRGLEALAAALAQMLNASVGVLDAHGEPLATSPAQRAPSDEALASLGAQVRDRAALLQGRQFAPSGYAPGRALALPVASDAEPPPGVRDPPPDAWLVVVKDSAPLSELDRLMLGQAQTIVALELLRRRVAGEAERRLAGELIDALAAGELNGDELSRRLRVFGLGDQVAALALVLGEDDRGERALGDALRAEGLTSLSSSLGHACCALIGVDGGEDELFALAERVRRRVELILGFAVTLGVGRAVAARDARRSLHEARCALEAANMALNGTAASANGHGDGELRPGIGRRKGPAACGRVATYRDLGAFQLLLALQGNEALGLYCDSLLAPIEHAEGRYGGELLRSLEIFIEENGQWERAARRLYCHRHTLRYRIRRIEELTGRDLQAARDRIEFWLAIRGRELVS
jgi:purine catabolism regulator